MPFLSGNIMHSEPIKNIVIVGGGTAGWMTGAALANKLPKNAYNICLIESDAIGTVGVGESTLPHIKQFNESLGIDEREFIQATNATIKLGIQFQNWGKINDEYMHPFSEIGHVTQGIDFHHYWLKSKAMGENISLDDYSVVAMAAKAKRFAPPNQNKQSMLSSYAYSYHIDATAYAAYLRQYAEKKAVKRIEGKVTDIIKADDDGFIDSVILDNGEKVAADLFIDCSGFSALLIEKSLNIPFTDWSHWLPTDSAVVVQSERDIDLNPYTIATARSAGWQWQIPLQHRMGNGHVYSRSYVSDEDAFDTLMSSLPGKAITEPRILRFKAGCREKAWHKNCVAIGLSSGFLEPLESTSIFLIQIAITKLIEFFPNKDFHQAAITQYNQTMSHHYIQIRNFIILHYHATQRNDSDFWHYCREMSIPDELQHLLSLFKEGGRVDRTQFGIWPAVCIGQGVIPEQYDARIDNLPYDKIQQYMNNYRMQVQHAVNTLPSIDNYLLQVMKSI